MEEYWVRAIRDGILAVVAALGARWACCGIILCLTLMVVRGRRQERAMAEERVRERRVREELEAYTRLDPSLMEGIESGLDSASAAKALARRVCRTIAERSLFSRVSMLLRNAEGRLVCVGSVGMDDLTLAALGGWAEKTVVEERGSSRRESSEAGLKSFSIPLGTWSEFDREVGNWAMQGKKERRRWRRAMVAPIRTRTGRMVGAIVICADGGSVDQGRHGGLERAMSPIEALASRLATAMENEVLTDRLLRAEKLAGLGQLAGGVAHALNNPLTAVLGFAELIAETANEARVRKDAATIQLEALKMKDTVQRLVEFWRPVTIADEAVEIPEILVELAMACAEKLEARGVTLTVTASEQTPEVRGSRDRLRQVMEHLLNNAAQAIASSRMREEDEEHAIRVTVSHDDRGVQVIVSDSGPGFSEPGRVFDPFYTTKSPDQGSGLGLSICYGIVREHGGEISAFNLHPHGAAVVVELPLRKAVKQESVVLMSEAVSEASLESTASVPERRGGRLQHKRDEHTEMGRS